MSSGAFLKQPKPPPDPLAVIRHAAFAETLLAPAGFEILAVESDAVPFGALVASTPGRAQFGNRSDRPARLCRNEHLARSFRVQIQAPDDATQIAHLDIDEDRTIDQRNIGAFRRAVKFVPHFELRREAQRVGRIFDTI